MTLSDKNILLCEALGWKHVEEGYGWPPDKSYDCTIYGKGMLELPSHFLDPSAALALCDFMAENGWELFINNIRSRKTWCCVMLAKGSTYINEANTLPTAISEAAGQALGLWKSETK